MLWLQLSPELRAPSTRQVNQVVVRGNGRRSKGEKVLGNNQTISYRVGGRYAMKTNFKYTFRQLAEERYVPHLRTRRWARKAVEGTGR
jgi:hypothetical protein